MISLGKESVLTVDDVTNRIREAVSSSKELQNMSVRGELLGFKRHSSGHAYFTILGKDSRISCVLFRSNANSVVLWPKDGDEVLVRGSLDVYGARGSYQIYATTILPIGEGAKARAKELLQNNLTSEGLFDARHKRAIPDYPDKVAIITSPTGAALQDVIKITSIRYPVSELVVIPSLMQGIGAENEILNAFAQCSRINGISLVMLVRGGGSRDDLDTFDYEPVVRAIRSCPVPVITGLGHQIDKTLSDLAADASAPTPSGAAERVFPDYREIVMSLNTSMKSISSHLNNKISGMMMEVSESSRRMEFNISVGVFQPVSEYLKNAGSRIIASINHRLSDAEYGLASSAKALQTLSPLNILSRGYAICRTEAGLMLKDVSSTSVGEKIEIQMRDGSLSVDVTAIMVNYDDS